MRIGIAAEWLNSCAGCEMAMLNMGEAFLDLLQEMDFLHMPLLMDHKFYGQTGESAALTIPVADIGIISGGIRSVEHLDVAEEMRKKCRIVVAMGACATHGGIPALGNRFSTEDILRRCFQTSETIESEVESEESAPALLDRTYALDEKIKVDVFLQGCPPHPDHISTVLRALANGEQPSLPTKSVCDACPTRREGKGSVLKIRRYTRNVRYQPDKPLSEMKCLLENGLLCMGPVTLAGCGGAHGKPPQCIAARVPCRGCYGPIKRNGNQLLDMMNALTSNGIDIRNIPDRLSLLRFTGAHGLLTEPGRNARIGMKAAGGPPPGLKDSNEKAAD